MLLTILTAVSGAGEAPVAALVVRGDGLDLPVLYGRGYDETTFFAGGLDQPALAGAAYDRAKAFGAGLDAPVVYGGGLD